MVTVYYLEVKVKLRTLTKRFLGDNPSICLLLEKKNKKLCFSFPLAHSLFPRRHWFYLSLGFLYVLFIEDNESLKHGRGVRLQLSR